MISACHHVYAESFVCFISCFGRVSQSDIMVTPCTVWAVRKALCLLRSLSVIQLIFLQILFRKGNCTITFSQAFQMDCLTSWRHYCICEFGSTNIKAGSPEGCLCTAVWGPRGRGMYYDICAHGVSLQELSRCGGLTSLCLCWDGFKRLTLILYDFQTDFSMGTA